VHLKELALFLTPSNPDSVSVTRREVHRSFTKFLYQSRALFPQSSFESGTLIDMDRHAAIVAIPLDPETATKEPVRTVAVANTLIDAGLSELREATQRLDALGVIETAIHGAFAGSVAVLSSFGAESAVLLHLVSQIDVNTPVLFVDTGRMFPETLAYRDRLQGYLGLTDVRTAGPASDCSIQPGTGKGRPQNDVDGCCFSRKVLPLARALGSFAAVITGRKRFQTKIRATMEVVEVFDGRFRFNPLAPWTPDDLDSYMNSHGLPRHPLAEIGYSSIGCCEPCTHAVGHRSHSRMGRWPGRDKEECGIHTIRGAA
jgi:phosphoadenosine phosphosulfate reductase